MDAVVIGDSRPFPVALIIIDEDPVAHFCRTKGITFSTYADLTRQPEVMELIESEVKKVNKKFAERDKVVRHEILEKPSLITALTDVKIVVLTFIPGLMMQALLYIYATLRHK